MKNEGVETCVVCGKDATGNRGFARIQFKGMMISLCCPGCMESFETKPDSYLSRLDIRNEISGLSDATGRIKKRENDT